jgi:uncharacterized protein (TIGR00730 family)
MSLPEPSMPPLNLTQVPDSWRIFRIMAEFVDGFEMMASLGPAVAIFGSTNPNPQDLQYYRLAEEISKKIAAKGFAIITGGGPGIMECANKGAQEGGGKSCGLCINLPIAEAANPYIDTRYEINFRYFFVRKVMFVRYAKALVILPGGYGTMDEFFEALTLIQTKKTQPFPIYLVGRDYYKGLLDWLRATVLAQGNITKEDFDLIRLSDDPDEIANGIEEHQRYVRHIENF